MCVSTDYPHFDLKFPNVSNNLLLTVPRAIAAQILLGGAGRGARRRLSGPPRPARSEPRFADST